MVETAAIGRRYSKYPRAHARVPNRSTRGNSTKVYRDPSEPSPVEFALGPEFGEESSAAFTFKTTRIVSTIRSQHDLQARFEHGKRRVPVSSACKRRRGGLWTPWRPPLERSRACLVADGHRSRRPQKSKWCRGRGAHALRSSLPKVPDSSMTLALNTLFPSMFANGTLEVPSRW